MDSHAAAATLWSIGHSTREWEVFVGMLREAGIRSLVDVRRFAGSRRNPQFSGEAMARTLPEAGIVAFQAGFEAWREVVGADGIEPTVAVHQGGSGAGE